MSLVWWNPDLRKDYKFSFDFIYFWNALNQLYQSSIQLALPTRLYAKTRESVALVTATLQYARSNKEQKAEVVLGREEGLSWKDKLKLTRMWKQSPLPPCLLIKHAKVPPTRLPTWSSRHWKDSSSYARFKLLFKIPASYSVSTFW